MKKSNQEGTEDSERTEELEKQKVSGLATQICMWKDEEGCDDCELDTRIFCKPKPKYSIMFAIPSFFTIIVAFYGILTSEIPITAKILGVGGYVVFLFLFLNVWESHMLCNHCPYYANDEQRTLHCAIDRGKLKTGSYDPGPLSKSERYQFLLGVFLFLTIPIPFLIWGAALIPLVLTIFGSAIWVIVLQTKVCTDCVNFSCPLNKVPKKTRDAFIKKNPIIREAWEKAGYDFDE